MHTIQPARLLPGVDLSQIPEPNEVSQDAGETVRGKALIFWDPKTPGKKLDAIDTDQITPAADCVSESIAEARQAAGRKARSGYLMPDFRKRVHDGQNFVVAGERFAIGSSREMSPAGLKADRRGSRPARW